MLKLPALWLCGNSQVELFDICTPLKPDAPLWRWDAATAPDMPEGRRPWFEFMDEVKPVSHNGAACLLVTASWRGGVALVRRSDKAVLFTLNVGNAHSADLLPGGWVAIAASAPSDKLVLQHVSAGVAAAGVRGEYPFLHGHGAVFESRRSLLWVSGSSLIRAYRWEGSATTFKCEAEKEIVLPTEEAHDLIPDPYAGGLIVTTVPRVWRFNTETYAFSPFEPAAAANDVKSVSVEASSGALAYVRTGAGLACSEEVHLEMPDGQRKKLTFAGRALYKARWDQSCQL